MQKFYVFRIGEILLKQLFFNLKIYGFPQATHKIK